VTVVWWEGKRAEKPIAATQITYCAREEKLGKEGAALVAQDLAELPWVGKVTPKPSQDARCLHDVKLEIADGTELPARR